jgi:hypothetical protein
VLRLGNLRHRIPRQLVASRLGIRPLPLRRHQLARQPHRAESRLPPGCLPQDRYLHHQPHRPGVWFHHHCPPFAFQPTAHPVPRPPRNRREVRCSSQPHRRPVCRSLHNQTLRR